MYSTCVSDSVIKNTKTPKPVSRRCTHRRVSKLVFRDNRPNKTSRSFSPWKCGNVAPERCGNVAPAATVSAGGGAATSLN
ncbi:unnamed protein product [Colias eurytheme]|nr:unnamed protein product [Colias eurytheme]